MTLFLPNFPQTAKVESVPIYLILVLSRSKRRVMKRQRALFYRNIFGLQLTEHKKGLELIEKYVVSDDKYVRGYVRHPV